MSDARPPRPDPLAVDVDAVPGVLQEREQWICWRYEWDRDRDEWTKVPVDADTGGFAKSTDAKTWGTFEDAVAYHEDTQTDSDGLGFVFDENGTVAGLDLDDCRDPDTGALSPWAADLVDDVETFTEVSPSGTGLHLYGLGFVPDGGNRADVPDAEGHVEMYDSGRFFTVTGARLEDTLATVEQVNGEIGAVHTEYIADDTPDDAQTKIAGDGGVQADSPGTNPTLDAKRTGSADLTDADKELLSDALADDETGYLLDLWTGEWEQHTDRWQNGSSHSEADLALCSLLAKYTDDAEQLDRMFRASGLYRGKWDRDDYAERTIKKALSDPPSTDRETTETPNNPGDLGDEAPVPESDFEVMLAPGEVKAQAGLDEDEGIADLSDREKAACVWELVHQHDKIHVRVRRDSGELWAYDGGVWTPEGERALQHAGAKALGKMNYGENVLRELKAQVRADPRAEIEADEFGLPTGEVAVENGLVDLQAAADGAGADAVRDLEPEDYALSQLPVAFDPAADATEWKEFVGEVVEPEKIQAVQEYVGYTLHRDGMPFSKALLLVGSGSNGKTTFLNVVRDLLGTEHTTTKPVHQFDEDNHVADLYGALANIDADLSEGSLSSEGIATFKRLVGGDSISARRLYKDAFTFEPTAKHLYACNQVPDVSTYVTDHDIAFWRRWIVVEFPNYFPPGARDPDLEGRLTTDESLSGVLNWAIEGWGRLHETGGFSNIESHDETRQLWQSWGESIEQFITECVENDPTADRISTGDAYARYQAWCRENGADPVGRRRFTDTLKQENVGYSDSVRINGKVQRGYKALGLADEVPTDDDDSDDDAAGSQARF